MQRGNQRDSRFKSRDKRRSGRINTMEGYRYRQDVKTLDIGYWYIQVDEKLSRFRRWTVNSGRYIRNKKE